MADVLAFPLVPGRTLATIDIVRTPDGKISARVVDMAIGEIESRDTIKERFDAVIEWLGPAVDSLKRQGASFEEPTK